MKSLSRREFLASSAAVGATLCLPGTLSAAPTGQQTFTILRTNDRHSAFIDMGPAADYTPFTLNDDTTRGGYARLAALIAGRKEARKGQGPVLVLDAGDYSMGTAFAAASRETGGELQLMSRMDYDATRGSFRNLFGFSRNGDRRPGGQIDVNPCRKGSKSKTPGGRNLGVGRQLVGRVNTRKIGKLPERNGFRALSLPR
jgi:hypothetical protein